MKVSNDELEVSKITFGAAVFSGWHNHIEEGSPLLSVRRALELGTIYLILLILLLKGDQTDIKILLFIIIFVL